MDTDTKIKPRTPKFKKSTLLNKWEDDKSPGHPRAMEEMLQDMVNDIERTEAPDFFDVGCFIGWYACHIGLTFRDTKIHAFDMNPAACFETATNLQLNNIKGHVVCGAVHEIQGRYRGMIEHQVACPATLRSQEVTELSVTPYRVPTMSLSQYAHQTKSNPKVIKLDLPGDEDMAIMGLIPSIRGNDQRAIYLEISAGDDERMLHKVVNLIEDHRFVSHRYEIDGAEHWRFRR